MSHGVSLLLCGDVMLGRGIDQVLPFPAPPQLQEPYVRDARQYVGYAEEASGPIPRAVDPTYVWGPLLEEFVRSPDQINLINLETALTTSDDFVEGKAIHYRMNPRNVGCLTVARIRCCALANNHVLDWGVRGLEETLGTLDQAGLKHAGAGMTAEQALAPATLETPPGGRVLVFGAGSWTSGIPVDWAASAGKAGVHLLEADPDGLGNAIRDLKRPGDIVVVSIHWGGNWGYDIPGPQRELAHRLIDEAGVDLIHGHSSHHVKGMEVYRGRLILYGCGDLVNDYEGIGGHEPYRPDLGVLYRADLDPSTGHLVRLGLTATRRRRFQLQPASPAEVGWLKDLLEDLGSSTRPAADGSLLLRPAGGATSRP